MAMIEFTLLVTPPLIDTASGGPSVFSELPYVSQDQIVVFPRSPKEKEWAQKLGRSSDYGAITFKINDAGIRKACREIASRIKSKKLIAEEKIVVENIKDYVVISIGKITIEELADRIYQAVNFEPISESDPKTQENFELLAQSPLNDLAEGKDLLNIKDEVYALAEVLLMRDLEPPIAVGILGGWGTGKSHIMHLMQTRMSEIRSQPLKKEKTWGNLEDSCQENTKIQLSPYVGHIYQIKFDAWTYARSNLWSSFMQTIFFELDRQITLEQQLQEALQSAGISPLDQDQQSGLIWQALYETSDEDRKWFLERTLSQATLEKWKENSNIQSGNDQLWDLFATSQTEALNNLKEVEKHLKEQQKVLLSKRAEILDQTTQDALFFATGQTLTTLLKQRLGKSFVNNIQEKVITQLTTSAKEAQESKVQLTEFYDSIKTDIENVFEEQDAQIDRQFIIKFVSKNWELILFCTFLLFIAAIIPPGLAWLGASRLTQAVASLTPFLGAIPIAHGLLKKGQNLYGEVKLGISEFKQQLEQNLQHRLNTDQNFRELNRQVQFLEKEVEAQYAAIPINTYTSIPDFVNDRLQKGGYQDQLGIIHQVKEDLAVLSKRLLPPPIKSKEYAAKFEKLQKAFPRGSARVVLYIDDLDRCPPSRVVEVLEAVQLLVKTRLFVVILAIDERYIARALEKEYAGVLLRNGKPSGIDYIEKIIQIPYRVRPISPLGLENYLKVQMGIDITTGDDKKLGIGISPRVNPIIDVKGVTVPPDTNRVIPDDIPLKDSFQEIPHQVLEFSKEEFDSVLECCQNVDLSPRTLKRLINVYKLFKIIWFRSSGSRDIHPKLEIRQAIVAFLALAGRYPNLMRDVFEDLEIRYEQQEINNKIIDSFLKNDSLNDNYYINKEWNRLCHDVEALGLGNLSLKQLGVQRFNMIRSFCFVGDIGYDPDDFIFSKSLRYQLMNQDLDLDLSHLINDKVNNT